MRIEHLIYLLEIKRRKSLNAAAKHLGLTQQALSASVKSIEQELGTQILIRKKQGCSVTLKGKEVMEFAEDITNKYQLLLKSLKNIPATMTLKGTLRIYTNSPFFLALNPEIIKQFCTKHPQVKISITDLPQDILYKKLLTPPMEDDVEHLGIINAPFDVEGKLLKEFLPPFPSLRFQPFMKGGYLACVSTMSPLAHSKRLSLRTLLKYPIVMGASEEMPTTPLHYLLKQYGSPLFVLSAATLTLWSMGITNNSGIGFIHDALLKKDALQNSVLQDLVLIRIKEHMSAATGYVLPEYAGRLSLEMLKYLPSPISLKA